MRRRGWRLLERLQERDLRVLGEVAASSMMTTASSPERPKRPDPAALADLLDGMNFLSESRSGSIKPGDEANVGVREWSTLPAGKARPAAAAMRGRSAEERLRQPDRTFACRSTGAAGFVRMGNIALETFSPRRARGGHAARSHLASVRRI